MGISERKEREKLQLRDKIVEAATELFLEHGFEKTSIRTIASAIEYSPATIYLHFKDKNELFFEIAERSFQHFYQYLKEVEGVKPPIEKLRSMGMNYIKFAFEHPGYYNLMFIMEAPMKTHHTDEEWHSGEHAYSYLYQTVIECQESGYFSSRDPHGMALFIWSFMHGMVSLKLRDRMKAYTDEQVNELIYGTFSMFNEFLKLDHKV